MKDIIDPMADFPTVEITVELQLFVEFEGGGRYCFRTQKGLSPVDEIGCLHLLGYARALPPTPRPDPACVAVPAPRGSRRWPASRTSRPSARRGGP